MRKLVPMLASASAAALTTLTVTVAVPAIADDAGTTKNEEDAFVSCLHDQGLDGAPSGVGLKPWIGERMARGDAATKRALEACSSPRPGIVLPGPSAEELRSCLTDHGVSLPGGDARALKRWLVVHSDDTASRDAMKACGVAPEPKLAGGACGKPVVVERAKRGEGKLRGGEGPN